MSKHRNTDIEEPFFQQEIIIGLMIAVGMFLIMVNEAVGLLVLIFGMVFAAAIYIARIIRNPGAGNGIIACVLGWLNNGALVLAAAGVIFLILMNTRRAPVFYAIAAVVALAFLFNAIAWRNNFGKMAHITFQLRLVIAMVVMVVFFLL
jgi:hypothetical protein